MTGIPNRSTTLDRPSPSGRGVGDVEEDVNQLRRTPYIRTIAVAALAGGLLAGCGDDAADPAVSGAVTGSDQAATGNAVTISESRFGPGQLVVASGTEVTFTNLDSFAHTVTAVDDAEIDFDSGDLGQSETFVQAFDTAGSYAYFCGIHPTMRAEIVVMPPADGTATALPGR